MVAQKRHHLNDMQVQMARELGFKPDSLRKIDNHKQEPWKTPLPQHIENLYEKRFKREQPEVVKPLKQQLQEDAAKRAAKKKAKDARVRQRRNLINNLLILNDIMAGEYNEYDENGVDDMMADYDYHINTGELPELFDESSVENFIANLNDWD